MSGSVTPARRSREESEEEDDFEVSVDVESPPQSNRSKRARFDEKVGYDEEDMEMEAPLLPDSFRRSPKGKGCAVNGRARSNRLKTHQPGSIVRVTLTDFVTYTKAEFNPGPNLNMVIGPNGTGKSTLVCAICIGLGWATKHLGRGKDLDEFVKHGAKSGAIEIELAADPERHNSNPVIKTRIKKGDKANAEYWIDGKKENKKRVHELCRSFSIQVDNLCQFLPQDRVVEFAGLSPVELLAQTQRAAAPQQMTDWHEQLKTWRKDQKQQQAEQQSLAESIKRLEDKHRLQEPDVARLRERVGLQFRMQTLEKSRPLPTYRNAKDEWSECKARRNEAIKELQDLERRMAPNLTAVTQQRAYADAVKSAVPKQKKLVSRVEEQVANAKRKIDTAADKIQECNDEKEAERNSMSTVRKSIPQLQRTVTGFEKAMENPPEEFDAAALNTQTREITRHMRELGDLKAAIEQEVGSLGQQMAQRARIIEDAHAEKESLRSQAGQQMNKLASFSKDAARAWEWIKANRDKFEGEVFGPPLVECRVKDEGHAPAVESIVQQGDALAFTVTSKADFDMLTDQLDAMKIRSKNIRASLKGLDAYRTPTTDDALPQYGLQGWLLELLEGPEPVLAMLCDNRNLHQTAYTFRDITASQFSALQQSPINSWVTSKQSHMIQRRREYGDKAVSIRVQELKTARLFTKVSIDHQQQFDIDRRVAETQSELDELKESRLAKMEEMQGLKAQHDKLRQEREAIDQEKKDKQSRHSQYNALPMKLRNAEDKVNQAREQLASSAQRTRAMSQRHDAICLEKGQFALDYANAIEQLRVHHIRLVEAEILAIEATSGLEQLEAQHVEEQRQLNDRKVEVERVRNRLKELKTKAERLQRQCIEVGENLTDEEMLIWNELEHWTLDQYETELVSLTARLESMIGGGNEHTIREYEEREKEIERKTVRFNDLRTALGMLEAEIAGVREQWEPQLDALVEEISEAFADNFAKIQCAGEVDIYKDEDFEQWAIQIKVKFRENEPLSLLDSHRQSGGERAVSTIFYLMALQSLARAPFRVVDEINQGMDPRNERLVHSRMVDIACAEMSEGRQGSQYFLITPKLLQGLRYHPDMKVHCIASGEHMPDDFREIDFARAAKRALELRGRQTGVAAG